jgi:transcriptional regulator with XRE-family HTH domain
MAKTLAQEIKDLRQKAQFTLRSFATRVGHTATHQSDIENGKRMPSDDALKKIADALEHVGATYEGLKKLDPRLEPDLERWLARHADAKAMLREAKDSGRPVREILDDLRKTLNTDDEKKQ